MMNYVTVAKSFAYLPVIFSIPDHALDFRLTFDGEYADHWSTVIQLMPSCASRCLNFVRKLPFCSAN